MNTSSKSLTTDECKRILFKVGLKLGVSPKLISERLLSDQDKCDMLSGEISIVELEASTEVWRDNGMPDYANGKTIPLSEEIKMEFRNRQTLEKLEASPSNSLPYRAPFVPYAD